MKRWHGLYTRLVRDSVENSHPGRGKTVLVVEDDAAMAGLLRTYLEHEGYTVKTAETGDQALEMIQQAIPHVVLLDLMLPGTSGWDVLRSVRLKGDMPVIMVTALRAEEDRLRGFERGADDYVVKPFSPRELVARVGAVLRRRHVSVVEPLAIGALLIDPQKREVRVDGVPVVLREREFDLITYLAAHRDEVCSRADLLDQVWGYTFHGDARTIDTHVRRLREALGPAGSMIRTVWGIGYRLSDSAL